MYDVTSRDTFENVTVWMQKINEYAMKNAVIILVATKCDRADARVCSFPPYVYCEKKTDFLLFITGC